MKALFILLIVFILQVEALGQLPDSVKQHRISGRQLIAPAALISVGLLTIDKDLAINRRKIDAVNSGKPPVYNQHYEDYLQYAPIAAVYGLNLAGVKGKNSVAEETLLLLKSELLTSMIVYTLKHTTDIERPDNSNNNSFPSGHTSQAFVAATFLHKEFGERSVWYSIGGYAIASTVGVMRVLGNHHWVSDVFVGAGLGILSTELVYATHQFKWSHRKKVSISGMPVFNRGAYGFSFSVQL